MPRRYFAPIFGRAIGRRIVARATVAVATTSRATPVRGDGLQRARSHRITTTRPGRARRALALAFALLLLVLPLGAAAAPLADADPDGTIGGLARINEARAAIGVPPLKRQPTLDSAASAHANYYRLNYGDPNLAGMGLHYEEAGKPGFTGADFAARAKQAGYSGSINENIGLSGSLLATIEWSLDTVNHRLPLLDPRYTDIGFGVINEGKVKIEVIDLGTITWRPAVEPTWEPWPPPDATNIATRFDGEGNNAFVGVSYPLGYPITLKYNGAGAIKFTGAKLTAGGQPIPSVAQAGTGFITRNTYMVAATAPLRAGTTYTVAIDGTLDGKAFSRSWSFTTRGATPSPGAPPAPSATPPPQATPVPSASPPPQASPTPAAAPAASLPPGVAKLDQAAAARWRAADYDVWRGAAQRTWTWGPDVLAVRQEPYAGSPGGTRTVYYFDKSRMELNDPNGDRTSPWFITNGLLVREMIAGQVQVGPNAATPLASPALPLAGDATNNNAVTYAALAGVASLEPGMNAATWQVGGDITLTIDAAGNLAGNPALAGAARYAYFEPTLGHNIPDVFWRWLGAQPVDWLYAVGLPLTEPYWTRATIGGTETWVLVQAFERRVLTFVPTNAPAWQVEAGNVGLHYYAWRYGESPTKKQPGR